MCFLVCFVDIEEQVERERERERACEVLVQCCKVVSRCGGFLRGFSSIVTILALLREFMRGEGFSRLATTVDSLGYSLVQVV